MTLSPVEVFLRAQGRRQGAALLIAALAGAATASGTTVLLGLSGWFLAGAALAGAGGALATNGFNYLLPSTGLRALAIVRTGGRYGERLFGHQAAFRALAALRPALFAALAAGSPERSLALSSGEASARLVQDVDAMETEFIHRPAPWAAGAAVGAAAGVITFASTMAAVAFVVGAALQVLVGVFVAVRLTSDPARQGLRAVGRLKEGFNAYATAAPELRAFNLIDPAITALLAHDAAMAAASIRRADAEAVAGLIQTAMLAATVAIVTALASRAPLPLAALADLSALAGMEGTLGLLAAAKQRGAYREALKRLGAMMGPPLVPPQPTPAGSSVVIDGRRLASGDRVAIVGPSGCGKTRTFEALLGLRAAPSGRFKVGGHALETLPVGSARGLFAYAPQDARLTTGTAAQVLRLAAPHANDAELWEALSDAQLGPRIGAAPEGLATWIGDGGEILSGGEQKRLSLARAYLRQAPWLLLDEPTEGLDAATETAVIAALGRRLARTGQGLMIVSHRPAPLALCRTRIDVSGLR